MPTTPSRTPHAGATTTLPALIMASPQTQRKTATQKQKRYPARNSLQAASHGHHLVSARRIRLKESSIAMNNLEAYLRKC